jgi:hypothetical protein
MTEEKKREQRAMILLEYEEARENLAQLIESARRMASPIEEVCQWIKDAYQPIRLGYEQAVVKRNENIRANPDTFRNSMNFDKIVSLIGEIAEAKELLVELDQRKHDVWTK